MEATTTLKPLPSSGSRNSGGLAQEHIVLICGMILFIVGVTALVVFVYMYRRKRGDAESRGTQHLIEAAPPGDMQHVDMYTHQAGQDMFDGYERPDDAAVLEEQIQPPPGIVEEGHPDGSTYIELETVNNAQGGDYARLQEGFNYAGYQELGVDYNGYPEAVDYNSVGLPEGVNYTGYHQGVEYLQEGVDYSGYQEGVGYAGFHEGVDYTVHREGLDYNTRQEGVDYYGEGVECENNGRQEGGDECVNGHQEGDDDDNDPDEGGDCGDNEHGVSEEQSNENSS